MVDALVRMGEVCRTCKHFFYIDEELTNEEGGYYDCRKPNLIGRFNITEVSTCNMWESKVSPPITQPKYQLGEKVTYWVEDEDMCNSWVTGEITNRWYNVEEWSYTMDENYEELVREIQIRGIVK